MLIPGSHCETIALWKKKSFCHPIWGVLVTVCCLSTKILTLFSSKLRITKLFSGMIWICKKKLNLNVRFMSVKFFSFKYHLSHGKDESSKYALLPTCDISVGSSVQLVFGRHRLEAWFFQGYFLKLFNLQPTNKDNLFAYYHRQIK